MGFTDEHARVLAELKPALEPSFKGIVDRFYEAITENPRAAAVFTGGQPQIERQKVFLTDWLHGLLSGTYDAEYLRLRAQIGRTHVRIRLDQRYTIGAMSVVRCGLHDAVRALPLPTDRRSLAHTALDKICDVELAIMVQTYAEDYSARLRDRERLATLGQLSGFIGHELRNPLAVMQTSLHLLRKRIPIGAEPLERHAQRLGEQLEICNNIISSLLELTRDRPLERTATPLLPLFAAARESVSLSSDIALELSVPDDLPVARVDEKQLRQVIVNLIANAADALSTEDGEKRIVLGASQEQDVLLIAIDDSGPGIAEELLPRLFEPLATTRQKGLGLGLALCRRVAEKHGGDIRASKGTLGGARFEVRLRDAFISVD